MIRFLSSMKFAYWSIFSLLIWFFIGSTMSASNDYQKAFLLMNDMLIFDWFLLNFHEYPIVIIWLVGLCFFGLVVFLSFLSCTATTLLKYLEKNHYYGRSLILFLVHIVFILILGFHFFSMIMGAKNGHIKAFENQIFEFNSGYSIVVRKIHFVDEPKILINKEKHSKIRLFSDSFSIEENYAEMDLFKDSKYLLTGKSYYLKPFVVKNIRITIEQFIFDSDDKKQPNIGVILTFAQNPFLITFFFLYALAVFLILLYVIIIWKLPVKTIKKL